MIPFILPWLVPSIYFTIHPWPWPQTSAAKVTAHGHRPPATAKVAKQATTFRGFRQRSMGPKLGAAKSPRVKSKKKRLMMSQKREPMWWWWCPKDPMKSLPEYFVGLMVGNIPSKNNRIVGLIPGSLGHTWILRDDLRLEWDTSLFENGFFCLDPGKKYERWYFSFEWCECVRYRVNMFRFNTEFVSYLITFLLTYLLTYLL